MATGQGTAPEVKEYNITPAVEQQPSLACATSGQKWWLAILIGFIYFIFASPILLLACNKASSAMGGPSFGFGGPNLLGLLLFTLLVIIVVRVALL